MTGRSVSIITVGDKASPATALAPCGSVMSRRPEAAGPGKRDTTHLLSKRLWALEIHRRLELQARRAL